MNGSPRRRWGRLVAGGALLLLLGLGGLSLVPAAAIRGHVERGRDHLTAAQASLLAGDLDRAAESFASAHSAFADARRHPGVFLLRLEGLVPFLGRTPDAVLSLAAIGEGIAAAGVEVSGELADLPEGLSSLGLRHGRIPLDALRSLAPAVRRARVALEAVEAEAERLPNSWVLRPVAEARDLVRAGLAEAVPLARAADALIGSLPLFAGEEGITRYFVAIQNSAELRGTGGLIGNYAILTIDRGALELGPFRDTQTLRNLPVASVPAPSEEFAALYDAFGGGGFWLNINMTPDAPTAASLIEALYERVEGLRLDGTIFFDLHGIEAMLESTGPVRIDTLGATLDSTNVMEYVAAAAYLDSGIADPFSAGPRLLADAIWERFLTDADPERALRALVEMAAGGHLVVHAADPEVQAAFHTAGVDGSLGAGRDDFIGVVLNNAAANKVDYFLRQEIRYEITLGPDGTARATATLGLRNEAPAGQPPSYLLGPSDAAQAAGLRLVPGENRSWAAVYCARCRLLSAADDAAEVVLEEHREQGLGVFAGFVNVDPQGSRQLRFDFALEDAWEGDRTGGEYRLRLQGQPLVVASEATVAIHAPDGMDVVWTSEPMDVHGERAMWAGRLDPRQDLAIRFTRPLPARVWTRVWDFLSKPVIRLS